MVEPRSLHTKTVIFSSTDKDICVGRIYPEDKNFLIHQSFTHYDGPRSGLAYKAKFWQPREGDIIYFQTNEELYYFTCSDCSMPVDFAPFVIIKITPEFQKRIDSYTEYHSKIWEPRYYRQGNRIPNNEWKPSANKEELLKEFFANTKNLDPEYFDIPNDCIVGWVQGDDLYYYDMGKR